MVMSRKRNGAGQKSSLFSHKPSPTAQTFKICEICKLPSLCNLNRGPTRLRAAVSFSSVVNRSAAIASGGYIPELKWFADWFCHYVAAFRCGLCHVPEVVSTSYMYPTSYYQSARSQSERREVLDYLLQILDS